MKLARITFSAALFCFGLMRFGIGEIGLAIIDFAFSAFFIYRSITA